MARIRAIEIKNFRGSKKLLWYSSPGINCLIGPGDSGKSSILDAIDMCIGARRNFEFSDVDFHMLNVSKPIFIAMTLGELDDNIKRTDTYWMVLRSFNCTTCTVEDELEKSAETVLTVKLTVKDSLEPAWALVSERAEA